MTPEELLILFPKLNKMPTDEVFKTFETEEGQMMTTEEWKRKNPPIQRKPQTNADRIRSMPDEELAMWINDITTNALSVLALGSDKQTKSIFYWLDWLRQEIN